DNEQAPSEALPSSARGPGASEARSARRARALDGPPDDLNDEAAVGRQYLPREVARARPRQEQRGRRDLACLAEPPEDGLEGDQGRLGGALLAEDVEQRRVDVAGRDRGHEDPLAAYLAGERLREGDDPALRRRVVHGAGDARRAGDARHVDDAAA